MFWPSAQDYNEAIQNPATSFADRDLRRGTVESNKLGLPKVMSGAFASVYKINTSESPWAVRCFLNSRPDHQERYKHISDFVLFDDLECTVPFYYLEQGIKIKGSWYPILKMEWVEGRTLEKFLDENFNKKPLVLGLLKQFDAMILDLNRAGIAHGDLQHGNVIVTEQGLRLVDYDALYVPALDGWQSPEVGHPNFQHPLRSERNFDPNIDNFSAWLIHLSLLALSIDPELYRLAEGGDDSILFKRSDFLEPRKSDLFRILVEHPATELRQAGLMLTAMLAVEPSAIPSLGATADELSRLPDMSGLYLDDAADQPLQSLSSSGENFSERVSKVLPQTISYAHSGDGCEVIIREAYDPGSVYPKEKAQVKLALIHRNATAYVRSTINTVHLRRLPRHWCLQKQKRATNYFNQGKYESAVPLYIELADILDLLANQRGFWLSAIRAMAKLVSMFLLVSCFGAGTALIISLNGLNTDSLFYSLILFIVLFVLDSMLKAKLQQNKFEPEKLLVETHLSLGYCFCFTNQFRVASNFFMMALRGCKWGIDPELRKRSLLLYAVCRNQGGERKEAIRFLLQKPEVLENLPALVAAENSGLRLTNHVTAFQMFFELGQSYIQKRLVLSAVPPFLAAKSVYESLSPDDQAQNEVAAREMFLNLAYIYTIRSNWTAAQEMFNELILHCTRANTKELWMAEFCAALSSNLRGDLTGATALMLRSNFRPGQLLEAILDKESIAHKILFYDRSRGVGFLQELGARLRDHPDRLMDLCSIMMIMFRSDVAPKPLLRILWLDELDDEFIATVFRRSYFDNRQPTSNELTVLIDASVAASLSKSVLILGQVMLEDNMLDRVDHLLNRMAALSSLNDLCVNEDQQIVQRVDRFFVNIVLRMASDQFKETVSEKCVALFGSTVTAGEQDKLSVKTLLECMLSCDQSAGRSASDIIYGAFDSPSIFKNENLQYRGILRFVELYLANRLAAYGMYEDSLILFDRLEGYYSSNIDRVLDKAIDRLEKLSTSDSSWLHAAIDTAQLASTYRSDASGRHLTRIQQMIEIASRKALTNPDLIMKWQAGIRKIGDCNRGSFIVLDTICDTAISLFQTLVVSSGESKTSPRRAELVDETCRFILELAFVYAVNNAHKQFLSHQNSMMEHVDKVGNEVALTLRLVASYMLMSVADERDAAIVLASVPEPDIMLRYVLSEPEMEVSLMRNAGLNAVDLFVLAGDIERDNPTKSRCFYLAAAFLYNALPLSTASKIFAQKLVSRLGNLPGSSAIENEIREFIGTDDRGNYSKA